MTELWRIVDENGVSVSVAAFLSRENAERTLEEWRQREARGSRPDVTTSGLRVVQVAGRPRG